MTVKELIEALQKMPPDMKVYISVLGDWGVDDEELQEVRIDAAYVIPHVTLIP